MDEFIDINTRKEIQKLLNDIQNESDFSVIREKNEFQEFLYSLVPYLNRKDLTSAEKVEIGNYQDLHP